MKNTIIGRIYAIKEDCKMNESQFAERIGKTQQAINQMFADENKDIKVSTIVCIANAFPEINIEWLITGEGSMKKAGIYEQEDFRSMVAEGKNDSGVFATIKKLENEIEILKQDKALQYKYISTLEQRIAELEKGSAKKTKSRKKAF